MTNGLNSMWIDVTNERGLWKSGENKTTLHFADWADGQPDPEVFLFLGQIRQQIRRVHCESSHETCSTSFSHTK